MKSFLIMISLIIFVLRFAYAIPFLNELPGDLDPKLTEHFSVSERATFAQVGRRQRDAVRQHNYNPSHIIHEFNNLQVDIMHTCRRATLQNSAPVIAKLGKIRQILRYIDGASFNPDPADVTKTEQFGRIMTLLHAANVLKGACFGFLMNPEAAQHQVGPLELMIADTTVAGDSQALDSRLQEDPTYQASKMNEYMLNQMQAFGLDDGSDGDDDDDGELPQENVLQAEQLEDISTQIDAQFVNLRIFQNSDAIYQSFVEAYEATQMESRIFFLRRWAQFIQLHKSTHMIRDLHHSADPEDQQFRAVDHEEQLNIQNQQQICYIKAQELMQNHLTGWPYVLEWSASRMFFHMLEEQSPFQQAAVQTLRDEASHRLTFAQVSEVAQEQMTTFSLPFYTRLYEQTRQITERCIESERCDIGSAIGVMILERILGIDCIDGIPSKQEINQALNSRTPGEARIVTARIAYNYAH